MLLMSLLSVTILVCLLAGMPLGHTQCSSSCCLIVKQQTQWTLKVLIYKVFTIINTMVIYLSLHIDSIIMAV